MTDSVSIFYLPPIITQTRLEIRIIIKFIKWVYASQFQIKILKHLGIFLNTLDNILLQWTRRVCEQICWTSERQTFHIPPSSFYFHNWGFVTYKGVKVGPEYPETVSVDIWILGMLGSVVPWIRYGDMSNEHGQKQGVSVAIFRLLSPEA